MLDDPGAPVGRGNDDPSLADGCKRCNVVQAVPVLGDVFPGGRKDDHRALRPVEHRDSPIDHIDIADAAEFARPVALSPDLPQERSVVVEDLDSGIRQEKVQIPEFFVPDDANVFALDDPRSVRIAQPDQLGDLEVAVVAEFEVVPVEDFLGGEGGGGEEQERDGD